MAKRSFITFFTLFLALPLAVAETPKPSADMVYVEGGTFRMGDNFGDGIFAEKPVHDVCLSGFFIGKYEVTVGEFRQFVAATGYRTNAEKANEISTWMKTGFTQDDGHPVVYVSWFDAVEYCNWKSRSQSLNPCYTIDGISVICDFTKDGYRLPTEAEWEYAARSRGKAYKYSWGNGSPYGNVADESAKMQFSRWSIWAGYNDGYVYTAPVGCYSENEAGLCDMSGNVWEWCWDLYGDYPTTAQNDPKGAASGTVRVLRGGSWSDDPRFVRSSVRYWDAPDYRDIDDGFRVVRSGRAD